MIFQNLELSIAFAYLRLRRFEGLITLFSLLGIILGVSTLIVVTSVMNGFHEELQKQISNVGGHIEIFNNSNKIDDTVLLAMHNNFKQIEYALPTVHKESLLSNGENTIVVGVKGIASEDIKNQEKIFKRILYGNLNDIEDGIIIGNQIASILNLSVGDEVKLVLPQFNHTIIGQIPRMKTYKVVAIFSFGMYEIDASLVYITISNAYKIYKINYPNFYEIYLKDWSEAESIASKMRELFDLDVVSWQEKQSSYFNALKTERSVMFVILSLIVIIASFNIISTLIMLVEDKKKSIAVLRSMGMKKINLMLIFMICGIVVSIIGTLIGTVSGVIFAMNINDIRLFVEKITGMMLFEANVYILDEIPVRIFYLDVIKIIFLSLFSASVATILPSLKAARTLPTDILRHE